LVPGTGVVRRDYLRWNPVFPAHNELLPATRRPARPRPFPDHLLHAGLVHRGRVYRCFGLPSRPDPRCVTDRAAGSDPEVGVRITDSATRSTERARWKRVRLRCSARRRRLNPRNTLNRRPLAVLGIELRVPDTREADRAMVDPAAP